MEKINVSDFKARCLAILDRIARTGERVTILKRGKAIAEIVPATAGGEGHPQETLRGTVEFRGDVIEPALPAEDWDAVGQDE